MVLTVSTSEAYSFLFRLLCDAESEILVPQPGYPLFDYLAVLDDVRIKPVSLVYDQGWQIEPEGFGGPSRPDAGHRAGAPEQPYRALHQAVGGARSWRSCAGSSIWR